MSEPATVTTTQDTNSDVISGDITDRIAAALEAEGEAPGTEDTDNEVIKDTDLPDDSDDKLPDDDDSEEDDDDQDDLDDIADDDLSLADYLGVEDDRITVNEETGAISLVAKIDGEDAIVPLTELVSSYQLQGHVNNKSIALEGEKKEFEETKTAVTTELETRIKGTMALSKALENELVADYNAVDWDALRTQDPANWTALRQEYAEKAQRIKRAQSLAEEQLGQVQEQSREKAMNAFQEHVRHNKAKVIEANPEWVDESKFKAGIEEINSFLKSTYAFSDDELKALNDHRLLSVIQDARAFRTSKEAGEGKRIGKKLPKFRKPGQSRQNAASLRKARAVKANRKRVKDGGGKVSDVAASILDRM